MRRGIHSPADVRISARVEAEIRPNVFAKRTRVALIYASAASITFMG